MQTLIFFVYQTFCQSNNRSRTYAGDLVILEWHQDEVVGVCRIAVPDAILNAALALQTH